MHEPVVLSAVDGRVALELCVYWLGVDMVVTLSGGDTPHIGAVALSEPYESRKNSDAVSASYSLLTVKGHKEGEIATALAVECARTYAVRVTAICGIHLDAITDVELQTVQVLVGNLVMQLHNTLATKKRQRQ